MQFTVAGAPPSELPTALSRWTSRIALFSFGLLVTAAFLHRLFAMPTPVAFNLVLVAYAGVALSLVTALLAGIGIWRSGAPGAARIVFGISLSLVMLAGPLVLLALARESPSINDVTTDTRSPPEFVRLAAMRGPGANPIDYPGESFAREQSRAYPDLKPMLLSRPTDEAFDLAAEAVRRLKMDIVREEAPTEGRLGMIEAVDRTLVAGFYDDVAIRIAGDDSGSRIDIRSASRYGWTDFGQNAERVRAIVREIVARLEASVPAADGSDAPLIKRPQRPLPAKRGKEGDPRSESPRKSPDRAR
jgi:uncharacterized protein (DUF1499 family)